MEVGKTLYLTSRTAWRKWLSKHHKTSKEIWLIYYKKATGKPTIEYDAAVEEALCYGWIDGQDKGIDAERYAQRFSPRKPGGNFSKSNQARVKRLITQGKMTKAGLTALKQTKT
ncbi:MAG: hypothetical protein U0517_03925 [Candidatus Andersenbacteria bacterium]